MALIQPNWNPSSRQLRQFGGICFVALPLLAWIWSRNMNTTAAFAGIGLLLTIVSCVYPKAILPLFVGLTMVTAPIGMVMGELAMVLVYMSVFLPIGIFFRLTSRDRLGLKLDRRAKSYWKTKRQPKSIASYYRQS
jgi:hypothetical protein